MCSQLNQDLNGGKQRFWCHDDAYFILTSSPSPPPSPHPTPSLLPPPCPPLPFPPPTNYLLLPRLQLRFFFFS